jgi:hypothetical protein
MLFRMGANESWTQSGDSGALVFTLSESDDAVDEEGLMQFVARSSAITVLLTHSR